MSMLVSQGPVLLVMDLPRSAGHFNRSCLDGVSIRSPSPNTRIQQLAALRLPARQQRREACPHREKNRRGASEQSWRAWKDLRWSATALLGEALLRSRKSKPAMKNRI